MYYIDTSVLLENIPLEKFLKTTSGSSIGCTELTPFLGRILIKVGRNTLTPMTS